MNYSIVLTDANLRSVYDEHGMAGLDAVRQLGPYLGSDVQKIKDEIERIRRERLEGLVAKKTVISSSIDASMLMEDYSMIPDRMTIQDYIPSINKVGLTQKFSFPVAGNPGTIASFVFAVASQSGSGAGNIATSISHQINPRLRSRFDVGWTGNKYISTAFSVAITNKLTADVGYTATFFGGSILHNGHLTVSHLIGSQYAMSASLMGNPSDIGVSLGFTNMSPTTPLNLNVQVCNAWKLIFFKFFLAG